MSLDEQIKQYYWEHFSEMPVDKQFHFASRMAAWLGESVAYEKLGVLKDFILPPSYDGDIKNLLKDVLATPQTGKRNAHELRQPYFQKYPDLYGLHLALFRVRHLKAVYGIDASNDLLDCFGQQKMEQLVRDLAADPEALRILSTFAVNTIYLHELLYGGNLANPQAFLEAAKGYDTDNKLHIQLLIYLYTHCIIGDSNFYTRAVPEDNKALYQQMLEQLEKLIDKNFQLINLDNKLEFLVCARIISFKTKLDEKIFDECARSISPQGTFLIDVHNQNMQLERQSFAASEHRNVLFIMASSGYQPHSTLA